MSYSTKMKAFLDGQGKSVATTTAHINFNQDCASIKRMIAMALRPSPQHPLYEINQITVHPEGGEKIILDQTGIDALQVLLKTNKFAMSDDKILMTINVKLADNENMIPNTRASSPARKFASPAKSRTSTASASNGSVNPSVNLLLPPSHTPLRGVSPGRVKLSSTPSRSGSMGSGLTAAMPNSLLQTSTRGGPVASPARLRPHVGVTPLTAPPQSGSATNRKSNADSSVMQKQNSQPIILNSNIRIEKDAKKAVTVDMMPVQLPPPATEIATIIAKDSIETSPSEVTVISVVQQQVVQQTQPPNDDDDDCGSDSATGDTWRDIPGANSPMLHNDAVKLDDDDNNGDVGDQGDSESENDDDGEDLESDNDEDTQIVTQSITPFSSSVEAQVDENGLYNNQNEHEMDGSAIMGRTSPASLICESEADAPVKNVAGPKRRKSRPAVTMMSTEDLSKPLNPNGKTCGEMNQMFNNNIRSYGDQVKEKSHLMSGTGTGGGAGAGRKKMSLSASSSVTPRKKSKKSNANSDSSLSPLFLMQATSGKSSKMRCEGRPSVGTMERQWEFMRAHFVGNADDELEWLMVSKNPGAYKYSGKKNDAAEDKYFKALYDIDDLEAKLKLTAGTNAIIPSLIAEMAALHKVFFTNANDLSAEKMAVELQQKLHVIMEKYSFPTSCEDDGSSTSVSTTTASSTVDSEGKSLPLQPFTSKTGGMIKSLVFECTDSLKMVRKAREVHANMPGEVTSLQQQLHAARKSSDDALAEMEKWTKRQKDCDEYVQAKISEEAAWQDVECDANCAALKLMRTYVPVNIATLSISDLIEHTKEQGGYLSLELASELKNNKLLHWVVTHPDDIAPANFLCGDKKQFFDNIEGLDVVELRALMLCLPDKFELDNDGKKAEWRARIVARARQMVSQCNAELVKGAWNAHAHKRDLVALPPLKPDQMRRPIYFYRTKEQCELRIKQSDDKQKLLVRKQGWLDKAVKEAEEAKVEYDTILMEMRDLDLKNKYGSDQFAKAKDIAKKELTDADGKRKDLTREVKQLQQSIDSAPMTKDQLITNMNELAAYLSAKDINWLGSSQTPVLISGVFDACPEIRKTERSAAGKFSTAEQDAEQRRLELTNLKTRKAADEAAAVVMDSTPVLPVTSTCETEVVITPEQPCDVSQLTASVQSSVVAATTEAIIVTPADAGMFSPASVRKKSVLASANPDMLACLNGMFSPQRRQSCVSSAAAAVSTPKTARRQSSMTMGTPGAVVSSTSVATEEVARVTKSKLLQKLLQPVVADQPIVARPNPFGGGGGGGGMSFLDQIKARKAASSAAGGGDSTNTTENSAPPRPVAAMSFLDQIKARSAAAVISTESGVSATAGDASSCGIAVAETPACPVSDDTQSVPRPSRPAMSMFDAIKARRKDD